MQDVARRAGVSYQTVSRVLNSPEAVRASTVARVQAAIAEVGYVPNLAARALKTRRSGIIGVIAPRSRLFGPLTTMGAIEIAARAAGMATLITLLEHPSAEAAQAFRLMAEHAVEGIVVVAPEVGMGEAITLVSRAIPTVVVASGVESGERAAVVAVDQQAGARLAVQHLAARGRRRIAHLAGPQTWFDARSRVDGWREAIGELGLDPAGCPLLPGDWRAETAYRVVRDLPGDDLPDAVFAANDEAALGVLTALRERDIRVPEEIAVVGFDDAPGSDFYYPPLTTVRQPFDELGLVAVSILTSPTEPGAAVVRPQLVVRQSS